MKMYNDALQDLSLVKQANIHVLDAARAEKNFLLANSLVLRDKYYAEWKRNIDLAKEFIDKVGEKFYTEAEKKAVAQARIAYESWDRVNGLYAAYGDATMRKETNARMLAENVDSMFRSSVSRSEFFALTRRCSFDASACKEL